MFTEFLQWHYSQLVFQHIDWSNYIRRYECVQNMEYILNYWLVINFLELDTLTYRLSPTQRTQYFGNIVNENGNSQYSFVMTDISIDKYRRHWYKLNDSEKSKRCHLAIKSSFSHLDHLTNSFFFLVQEKIYISFLDFEAEKNWLIKLRLKLVFFKGSFPKHITWRRPQTSTLCYRLARSTRIIIRFRVYKRVEQKFWDFWRLNIVENKKLTEL